MILLSTLYIKMERRQRPQACRCQEKVPAGIEFQKILESEEAGIVIYRYVRDTNNAGTGESYIIKNTKKQQATSEDFTIAFEQNKIICPRCVKILEHAESLVKFIPLIESQDVVSICDHCHRKGEKKWPRSSCWCRQIVNKFLIGRQLEEVNSRKHRTKQWLLGARQVLQNDSSRIDKIVSGLIRNKAMDDHVPFKQVEPTDSPPTGPKVRHLPFPENVHTVFHGLMRRDPNDNAMPKVNPVDVKFKQLEPTDGPSTGLKVRKPPFPESVHTDSHGWMRRDPSLDNSFQKDFENHLLNGIYKKNGTREPIPTKLSEEKQLGKKERKAPLKVASFLEVPEENVNPNMFIISKSQGGKIKETQKRPILKQEKNLATGRESRGLPVTSNPHLPKGSVKPVSKHELTKAFSFLFPQKMISTSSSFRFPSSTELLKNMQDMFKAQAEKEKLAKNDDFKRKSELKREREKNKIIDVAQVITGENDKKINTLTKDTDSSFGFGKEKNVERTSIDIGRSEASRNENAYTAAETNENKDHKKKEKKEQFKIRQEKKREKEEQASKDKEEKDKIKKDKQYIKFNDGTQKREKPGDEEFKPEKTKEDKSKKKFQTVHMKEQLDTSQPILKDKGVTLKDATSKREKPGDEKFQPEKAKEDKSKKKFQTLPMKEQLATASQPTSEKPGDEKLKQVKAKEDKLKDGTGKEDKLKDGTGKEDTKDNKNIYDLKYTLVTSQPTIILKDKPDTKIFNVVIPERPKPLMVVQKLQQPIEKEAIKLTKAREELIMKLIKLKQKQYGSREKSKLKKREELQMETLEAYAFYNESDIRLELAELEEISKQAAPGKRRDDDETVIIGTQIVKENINKNEKEDEIKTTAKA